MNSEPLSESMDLLAQVSKLHHIRAVALLEKIGLYRGQPRVLHLLWEKEGLSHSAVAERLRLKPATVTKMIQRMEKAGFVERRRDTADERVSHVYLTETGRAVRGDVTRILKTLEDEALAGFDVEEKTLLRRFFTQIRDNLIRATGRPPI